MYFDNPNDPRLFKPDIKNSKLSTRIILEDGKPMVFGPENNFGIILDGFALKVVEIGDKYSIDDLLVHNVNDKNLGILISEMTYNKELPVPFGIFYKKPEQTILLFYP